MPACSSTSLESVEERGFAGCVAGARRALAVVRLKPLPGFAYVSVEPALLLTLAGRLLRRLGPRQRRPAGRGRAGCAALPRADAAQLRGGFDRRLGSRCRRSNWNSSSRKPIRAWCSSERRIESVLVARFTVEFAARSGRIDWLLPDALLAPMREALAGDGGQPRRAQAGGLGARRSAPRCRTRSSTRARFSPQAQISLRELVQLSPGRHHSDRSAAAGHLAGRRRAAVSRPLRRLAGA